MCLVHITLKRLKSSMQRAVLKMYFFRIYTKGPKSRSRLHLIFGRIQSNDSGPYWCRGVLNGESVDRSFVLKVDKPVGKKCVICIHSYPVAQVLQMIIKKHTH